MRKRDFTIVAQRLQTLTRARFGKIYRDHHDADRDWIFFNRSRADFYLKAPQAIQEGLWCLVGMGGKA